MKILLGVSGSVAAIKCEEMCEKLRREASIHDLACEIKIVATPAAKHFLTNVSAISDEFDIWEKIGDPILHVELAKWADVFVIAPMSANTLAKMSVGICDNLLTCIARVWDYSKPMFFAPAMNTAMLKHPVTMPQIETLERWGAHYIPPIVKRLACGDHGIGAMADTVDIAQLVYKTVDML